MAGPDSSENRARRHLDRDHRPGRDESCRVPHHPAGRPARRATRRRSSLRTTTASSRSPAAMPTAFPPPLDADVIVALMQLTKTQEQFQEPTVNFTRYELLRSSTGTTTGSSFTSGSTESLYRWVGVYPALPGNAGGTTTKD